MLRDLCVLTAARTMRLCTHQLIMLIPKFAFLISRYQVFTRMTFLALSQLSFKQIWLDPRLDATTTINFIYHHLIRLELGPSGPADSVTTTDTTTMKTQIALNEQAEKYTRIMNSFEL